MTTSTMPMPLSEMLEHLQELANNGMQNSMAFTQCLDLYTQRTCSAHITSLEVNEAMEFLKQNSIGSLNIENMIESLED